MVYLNNILQILEHFTQSMDLKISRNYFKVGKKENLIRKWITYFYDNVRLQEIFFWPVTVKNLLSTIWSYLHWSTN